MLESKIFKDVESPLIIVLGEDIVGNPFIIDLNIISHLLVTGAESSGKSTGIHSMILSLLYRNDPENLKLILIDKDSNLSKLSIYNDIPHLLTPVIKETKNAILVLYNLVLEMERRYKLMAKSKGRDIYECNKKMEKEYGERVPSIVVFIDELADLIKTGGQEVEYSIVRLSQMARAVGIHLIIATQRATIDILNNLIKTNLPSRLSYKVEEEIDSKVILDSIGVESLLERGDALFTSPESIGLIRVHTPWIIESEIEEIVEFLKSQKTPNYNNSYLSMNLIE